MAEIPLPPTTGPGPPQIGPGPPDVPSTPREYCPAYPTETLKKLKQHVTPLDEVALRFDNWFVFLQDDIFDYDDEVEKALEDFMVDLINTLLGEAGDLGPALSILFGKLIDSLKTTRLQQRLCDLKTDFLEIIGSTALSQASEGRTWYGLVKNGKFVREVYSRK